MLFSQNALRRYLHRAGTSGSPSYLDENDVNASATFDTAPYALVTGATGGMGEEWAYQLAEHGFNVIIQGRNRSKLEKVRETILHRSERSIAMQAHAAAHVMTKGDRVEDDDDDSDEQEVARQAGAASGSKKTAARQRRGKIGSSGNGSALPSRRTLPSIDLLVCEAVPWPNQPLYDGLAALIDRPHCRLTIVINNLGVQSDGYPRLEDLSREEMTGIIVANSLFPAEVTRMCIPHLKRNGPSLCVTVTSLGAWTPTPYLSPYMGTKGFDVAFSHSLRSEMLCEGANVDIVCMVPGQVQSGMCAEPESLMVPTSRDWVVSAIASLRPGGLLGGILPRFILPGPGSFSWWARPKAVITPWWPHYMGIKVAQWGPTWLLDTIAVQTVTDLKQKHEDATRKGA